MSEVPSLSTQFTVSVTELFEINSVEGRSRTVKAFDNSQFTVSEIELRKRIMTAMGKGEIRHYEIELDRQTGLKNRIRSISTSVNIPPPVLRPFSDLENKSFSPQARAGFSRKDRLYVQYYDRIQALYPQPDDPDFRAQEELAFQAEKAADVLTFLAQPGRATLKEPCWQQVIRGYKKRYKLVFEELLAVASPNREEEILASGRKQERYPINLVASAFKELRTFGVLLVLMNQDQVAFAPENLKDFNAGFIKQPSNQGYFKAGIFKEYRERAERIEDETGIRLFDDLDDLPISLRLITWKSRTANFSQILSNPNLSNPEIGREACRSFMNYSRKLFPFGEFQDKDFQYLGLSQGPGFAILTVDEKDNSSGYSLSFSGENRRWFLRVRAPAIDEVFGRLIAERLKLRDKEPDAGLAMSLAIDPSQALLFLEKAINHFSK